ncbi:MAG: penicillin-binding protein 2 [Gammaproteobacteria bacterium]|nr:penicillin-binding protein 2 [Gammaproteobacteria bacterium]|tara:strand:- start:26016 stop:27917 length:1902 start_codon:yes stop_codon:yes gene_type:complete
MSTKARKDSIRKRLNIEEKYGWDRMSDSDEERKSHSSRVIIAIVLVIFVFGTYISKLYQLQVSEHEYYLVKAEDNRIKIRPIQAFRGLILDRHGKTLAENYNTFDLIVKKERVNDIDLFYKNIQKLLKLSNEKMEIIKKQFKNRRLKDVVITENISLKEFSQISVDQHIVPELEITPVSKRIYNHPEALAHVVGYIAKLSESDIESGVIDIREGMTEVGKLGVEKFYQNLLVGKPGYERLETNAQGEVVRIIDKSDPERGLDIHLTIDLDLQIYAYEQMKDKAGSVIVMNPNNGDILAMVSAPGYDTNLFTKKLTTKDYKKLISRKDKPLINRSIAGLYPPGSTIKPFVGLIALDENIFTKTTSVFCGGKYKLKNHKRPFKCWKKEGHGDSDLAYSITQSCDVFFYRLAEVTGIDMLSTKLPKYGFGRKTYIDLYSESSGLMPDRDWKRKTKQLPWYPGETLNIGIGQGYMLTTPIQLAVATSILAGKGETFVPHLFLRSHNIITDQINNYNYDQNRISVPMELENLDVVNRAMWRVVNQSGVGTAAHLNKVKNIEIAGKTGTAQVYSLDKGKLGAKELQDHALFISFAPYENPEIVVSVIVENGGGGSSVAAPIARDIINKYFKQASEVAKK